MCPIYSLRVLLHIRRRNQIYIFSKKIKTYRKKLQDAGFLSAGLKACVRGAQCGWSPDGTWQRWGKEPGPYRPAAHLQWPVPSARRQLHRHGELWLSTPGCHVSEGCCMLCVTSLWYTDLYT